MKGIVSEDIEQSIATGRHASADCRHHPLTRDRCPKSSFVDSSGHMVRDFVFTRARGMDSNETAVAGEFTK